MLDEGEKKKRGRKPKGGKIVSSETAILQQPSGKLNVILHLKCFLKDLQSVSNGDIQSYSDNHSAGFEIIQKPSVVDHLDEENSECDYEYEEKNTMREINRKLKQLETHLHMNYIGNRRACCFWDSCEFDNPAIYIPKFFLNGVYHVYGCFCSPECASAYLMKENIDSSVKFERYHLLNFIYSKVYGYTKNIKPAPNPHYMLSKYYGNLSIPEYRALFQKERLFLVVDKPMTRVLPELHEDNDSFILSNKIIAGGSSKSKKTNKNDILIEKFGTNMGNE